MCSKGQEQFGITKKQKQKHYFASVLRYLRTLTSIHITLHRLNIVKMLRFNHLAAVGRTATTKTSLGQLLKASHALGATNNASKLAHGASQHRFVHSFEEDGLDASSHVHFRASARPHPLNAKPKDIRTKVPIPDELIGDHTGRQQNHIWKPEELRERMNTLYRHSPKTAADFVMNKLMYSLYHTFNFFTGYTPVNPSVQSMEWRLILLESVAGVPGFVAAGFRHFRSLRNLQRDHGWIATLLEEAENERMHLLLVLNHFKAGYITRTLVVAAQYLMTPFLMTVYMFNPKAMHRFVGYLEETACMTYVNTIREVETPGTHLHNAWANLPAPPLAIGYYHLPKDAKWVDTLKCMVSNS